MPFKNFKPHHYLAEERAAIDSNLKALEASLVPKIKNLRPDERQKYESIGEMNRLVVKKIKDFRSSQPNLSSPDVDWVEFHTDFEARNFLQATITRLQKLIDGLQNNKIVHDFDNYQAALIDYDYSQYKAATKIPGFENKVYQVSQFFNQSAGSATVVKNTDTAVAAY